MLSYRTALARIGIEAHAPVSYRQFASRPKSLRAAMAAMDAPAGGEWAQLADRARDEDWTDEVQGVAWDGSHWIFCANANQAKPDAEDKAIYVFNGNSALDDDTWVSRVRLIDVPAPIPGTFHESDHHWGQLTWFGEQLYVAHFWENGQTDFGSVAVFDNHAGSLSFNHWIRLEHPVRDGHDLGRVEFQAINPWDGMIYSCFGAGTISELFIHHRAGAQAGRWTGRTLALDPPVSQVQGACFSPNGHLYIATNEHPPDNAHFQTIYCHSALNGHRHGVIPVLAEDDGQELEGLCFADVIVEGGVRAQLHVVLLDNKPAANDDMFFKSFGCARPRLA